MATVTINLPDISLALIQQCYGLELGLPGGATLAQCKQLLIQRGFADIMDRQMKRIRDESLAPIVPPTAT